ncbi:MAG: glutathione S-transferase family protein [Deltaproteobacteria bacterium]|nr:glutathione S-transferase family protein [Deltaproteobacteria bacterium]
MAELGVPCERVKLDLKAGDAHKPDFLKINPNGKVPAIVHEGTAIWESAAITMYLGEVFGVDAKLYPASGPKRGEAMKWIVWGNVTLGEAASRLAYSFAPDAEGADQTAAKAKTDIAARLKILDDALVNKSFLLGEYSLADTHLHGFLSWLGMMQFDLKAFSHVTEWLKRCNQRPALAKLMAG